MRCRSVRFLNEPWQIPEGMFHVAALAQAPILPVFTRRLGFLRYEYVTGDPMFLPRRPTAAQLDDAAQTLASLLESFARNNPTQWFRFSDG
jgi:KDO2-lipid IV(A) lauroyltransferase